MNPREPEPDDALLEAPPDDENAPPSDDELAAWATVKPSPANQAWHEMVEALDSRPDIQRLLRALERPPLL